MYVLSMLLQVFTRLHSYRDLPVTCRINSINSIHPNNRVLPDRQDLPSYHFHHRGFPVEKSKSNADAGPTYFRPGPATRDSDRPSGRNPRHRHGTLIWKAIGDERRRAPTNQRGSASEPLNHAPFPIGEAVRTTYSHLGTLDLDMGPHSTGLSLLERPYANASVYPNLICTWSRPAIRVQSEARTGRKVRILGDHVARRGARSTKSISLSETGECVEMPSLRRQNPM